MSPENEMVGGLRKAGEAVVNEEAGINVMRRWYEAVNTG